MSLKQLGPYRIEKLIGQGGMGAVYAAVDENSGERVAVKAIPTAKSQQDVFQRRFGSEITALKKLQHPNIVRILGHGSSSGYLFMAMELIDGPSLYDYFRKKRFLPWAEVIGYMLDVCKGLKHAHDRGYIHRDLKLGNLLLASTGQVKIADFGIARYQGVVHDDLRESITVKGGVVGTYDYMAPEQLRGEAATVRSDLYSLGVVMYVLLAGRTPFTFKSVNEALDVMKTKEIVPVGNLVPDLPPRLEKLVMRLLEKDPASRHSAADTVYRRLIEIIDGDADVDPSNTRMTEEPRIDPDAEEEFELNDEVHQRRTLVDGEGLANQATDQQKPGKTPVTEAKPLRSEPTAAADRPVSSSGKQPPVGDYYAEVTENERGDDDWRTEETPSGPIWPYVLGLVAVLALLAVGVYYTVLRKPTADQAYQAIASEVAEGESPESLEEAMRSFVIEYPDDPRGEEYQRTLAELDARKLPRRLQAQLNWQNGETLSDEQRAFVDALSLAKTRPEEADERLAAIEALLSVIPDHDDEELLLSIRSQRRMLSEVLLDQLEDRNRVIDHLLDDYDSWSSLDAETQEQWKAQARAALMIYAEDRRLFDKLTKLENSLGQAEEPTASSDSESSDSQAPQDAP